MKKVTIYSTPTCTYCNMTKDYLSNNDIPFEEYNVATDLVKRKEMVEKSGQMGVPVIIIDDEVMVGFDQDKLSEKLSIK